MSFDTIAGLERSSVAKKWAALKGVIVFSTKLSQHQRVAVCESRDYVTCEKSKRGLQFVQMEEM